MFRVTKVLVVGIAVTLIMVPSVAWTSTHSAQQEELPAGRIAFVSNREGGYRIYVIDGDGTHGPLTPGPWDWTPRWSPDCSQIAFYSGHGGAQLFLMDADGSNRHPLTLHPEYIDAEPDWSPDGGRIVFHSQRHGNLEVYVIDLSDKSVERMTDDPAVDGWPAWSPDGAFIAFYTNRESDGEIYVLDTRDSSRPAWNLTNSPGSDTAAAWSPDGNYIAFTSSRDGDPEIYTSAVVDGTLVDGTLEQLTHNSGHDGWPAWSPDGKWIAFQTDRNGPQEVYIVEVADPTNQVRLTHNSVDDMGPDWCGPQAIPATIDIDPDTLNLKSKGQWVTAYIELPEGDDVADIDVGTVLLEDAIPADLHPTGVGDHDGDGVPDLMVKFSRQDLIAYLEAKGLTTGDVELDVTGQAGDTTFVGSDTIRVR